MTAKEALAQLKKLGTAQNRKVYARHGVTGAAFGVSYGNLRKLHKTIKTDHDLAVALWASGNHDARILATMIADPDRMTARDLDAWIQDIDNYPLADAFSAVARGARTGRTRAEKWMRSPQEFVSTVGWNVLTGLAMGENDLKAAYFTSLLKDIERTIHSRPNRTRYAMNNALIAIGIRSRGLRRSAIAAARRIGKVDVDHGATGCKTPDAEPYIERVFARREEKAAKAGA